MIEILEQRQFLSVSLQGGVLTIQGLAGNDTYRVAINDSHIAVAENGVPYGFDLSAVTSIQVRLGAGNDKFDMTGVSVPASISGGGGNDTIIGGSGNDSIYGGRGMDSIDGGAGNDFIHGRRNADILHGGAGNDTIFGGAGNDLLYTDAGNDAIHGAGGWDKLYGGSGTSTLDGGIRADSISYFASSGSTVTQDALDTLRNQDVVA